MLRERMMGGMSVDDSTTRLLYVSTGGFEAGFRRLAGQEATDSVGGAGRVVWGGVRMTLGAVDFPMECGIVLS